MIPKKTTTKKPSTKPHVTKKPRAHATAKEHPKAEIKREVKPEVVAETQVAEALVQETPHGKNFYAVGRRKTAVAQVIITAGDGAITVNKLPFEGYFQTSDLRQIVMQSLTSVGLEKQMNVRAKIHGGGIHAQAEGMRHAISRALLLHNPESRRTLKKLGYLTRDSRVKERKKPGLKCARRAPQFSKR